MFYFIPGVDCLTGENFFDLLDNGVLVCHLARVIQDKAKDAIKAGLAKGVSSLKHFFLVCNLSARCYHFIYKYKSFCLYINDVLKEAGKQSFLFMHQMNTFR